MHGVFTKKDLCLQFTHSQWVCMKHLWSWCCHLKQDLCLNFHIVGAHVLQKYVNLHELCVQLLHMSFSILSKCAFSFISWNDWFSLASSSFEAHHTFKDGFYSSLSTHFVCAWLSALFWISLKKWSAHEHIYQAFFSPLFDHYCPSGISCVMCFKLWCFF